MMSNLPSGPSPAGLNFGINSTAAVGKVKGNRGRGDFRHGHTVLNPRVPTYMFDIRTHHAACIETKTKLTFARRV